FPRAELLAVSAVFLSLMISTLAAAPGQMELAGAGGFYDLLALSPAEPTTRRSLLSPPQGQPLLEPEDLPGSQLVAVETPEIGWLATWQTAYLDLLNGDDRALAGFYDPFSFQFAYGAAGAQPYRLGWYSYNDYVLMSRSPTT